MAREGAAPSTRAPRRGCGSAACGGDACVRSTFVRISLAANIGILIAVCTVLLAFGTSEPVEYCWGVPTAGRGILLSVYFSILAASIALLGLHVFCEDTPTIEHMVAALLATQILYKVTTPATAGPANPVAISNLAISVLHAVTLWLLWRGYTTQRVVSNEL